MSGYADLSRAAYISPNDLMASTQVNYEPEKLRLANQNALLTNQHNQQVIDTVGVEYMARAAQGLAAVGKPGDEGEAERAAAYPAAVAALPPSLRARAPAQYPGWGALQRAAALGTSSEKLGERGGALGEAASVPLGSRGAGGGGAAMAPAPAGGGTTTSLTPFVARNLPPGITPEEDLLVRTASGEAANQGPVGQQAVAAVIRNRARESGRSVSDVVFAPNQFEPWNNPATRAKLEAMDPNSPEYQRILANLRANQADPTGGATHFYSPEAQKALGRQPPSWGNTDPSAVIGGHNFYRIGYKPGGGAPGAFPAPQQTATAAPVAPTGGGGQPAPYQVATAGSTPPPPTRGGTAAAPAALPPAEATKQAQATGQPVPIAGVDGLWALPNGEIRGVAPAAPAQAPAATTQQPPPPPPPRPAEMPAELRTNEVGLRPSEVEEFERQRAAANTPAKVQQFRTDVEQRKAVNRAAQDKWREQEHTARTEAATARQREVENARAGVPTGMQRNAEGGLEPMPGYRGATADERINYALKNDPPDSQEYADAWRAKKWQTAPNGSVIETDMSEYRPPARSVRRPTFLPQPTGTALDEVRKADTDARVIVPSIDRYVDLHKKIGGSSWGAYFDDPKNPKAQQLIGAFNAMKTVLRSPTYANTGVLQPAEMEMLKQELVSPQTIRGLYASPQALEARLHEIKLAILSRQDAELRSVGRDGVIVRSEADLANVPDGGKFYDEDGNLRVKTKAEK